MGLPVIGWWIVLSLQQGVPVEAYNTAQDSVILYTALYLFWSSLGLQRHKRERKKILECPIRKVLV